MLIVTNGAESWILTNKMERVSTIMWKMKILRKLHTPTYENGYCRIKINQETYIKSQPPSTVTITNPSALCQFINRKHFEHFSTVSFILGFILRTTITNKLFPLPYIVCHILPCKHCTWSIRRSGCCKTLHNVTSVSPTFQCNYFV
jgi:hypothetical protein